MAEGRNRTRASRWRLLQRGPDCMGNGELLALWLGLPGPLAGEGLLEALGGLSTLISAAPARLLQQPELGIARIARLRAATTLVERSLLNTLTESEVLSCSSSVRRYLRSRLAHLPREVFGCLFLDNRHRLIAFETLFLGTVDRASVHPREILRRALELNAAALILTHNHPSGVAEPSATDVALTRDLQELLARVEVRVLDHLVVGRGSEVSFAERGLL